MSQDPADLPADWAAWRDRLDMDAYDERWARLAAAGVDPHGEVAFVQAYAPSSVLDAGCGTGRVAIELARRGVEVVGVDTDPDMIAAARAKEPGLPWVRCDLVDLTLPGLFDVVLLAGNVVPYVTADRRAEAVLGCARHLEPDGRLVAGFALRPGWPDLAAYDAWCAAAGLELRERWATWGREPYAGGDYAVSVHVIGG
ncbi:class I SAM-dependent methyltransferase [Pseudonocardia sp.]|uniref:class I SAM-dependent methyltransferase n=1 Tax=Pseudonocardia sp. TaxID=60912 RepID=UPI003D0DFBC5